MSEDTDESQGCAPAVVVVPGAPRVTGTLALLLDREVVEETTLGHARVLDVLHHRRLVGGTKDLLHVRIALSGHERTNFNHEAAEGLRAS